MIHSSKFLTKGSTSVICKYNNGTLWICIDYKLFSKATTKNRYPLLRIDDFLSDERRNDVFNF